MKEKSLEEQADELLAADANERGVSLRSEGIMNRDRARTVSSHEKPFFLAHMSHGPHDLTDYDLLREADPVERARPYGSPTHRKKSG